MIQEVESYVGTCDNCGDIFTDGEYSIFSLASDVAERMSDCDWFVGHKTDPEHAGKHYCDHCFKYDENEDDKIIVDLSRQQLKSSPPQTK